jgi:hypothetical protein
MRPMGFKTSALLALSLLAAACSSSPSPSGQGSHDSGGGNSDSSSGNPGSFDASSGSNPDATSGNPGDDASSSDEDATPCNTITNSGSDISGQSSTATAPTPTGGTITDGTYVLSSVVAYLPFAEDAGAGTLSGTIIVSGSTWQIVGNAIGDTEPGSFTFQPSGTSFTLTETCPGTESVTGTYTASTTQIILYKSTTVFGDTLTLQSTFTMM